jgi:hypothetical protein
VGEKVPDQDEPDCFSRGGSSTRKGDCRGLDSGAGHLCRIDPHPLSSALSDASIHSTVLDERPRLCLVSRGCSPGTHNTPSLRGLRPLAYPCLPSTPTTDSDGGWWAQDLQGPRFPRGRQCTSVPPYILGHIHPPCLCQSPELPSPMSPKYPAIPVPPPGPVHSHVPAHAMCGLSLAGPGALLGTARSSSTKGPGRQDGRGYIETSHPPKQARSSHHLALHKTSPTTRSCAYAPHRRRLTHPWVTDNKALGSNTNSKTIQLSILGGHCLSRSLGTLGATRRIEYRACLNLHARHSRLAKSTGPVSKARPNNNLPATTRHRARRTETIDLNPAGMRMCKG